MDLQSDRFLISGKDSKGVCNILIIELKQWSEAERTNEDAVFKLKLEGPSASSSPKLSSMELCPLLRGFNEAVHSGEIHLHPCAFLHNYRRNGVLDHSSYNQHLVNAPLFCQGDRKELRSFIADKVSSGDQTDIIAKLDSAKTRPSKVLAEQVSKMLRGNEEFVMIDAQKVVYEKAISFSLSATDSKKKVLLVHVIGRKVRKVNLLSKLTNAERWLNITKNSAPRSVYESFSQILLRRLNIQFVQRFGFIYRNRIMHLTP